VEIFVASEQDVPVDTGRVVDLARHALASENVDDEAELSVLFVTADHIRRLNQRFADNDYATDVLAFPMTEDEDEGDGPYMLGDVVICPEVARANAHRLGHSLQHEIDTLLVHGILHLLGYDHQGVDDKQRMDARLSTLLTSFRTGTRA
jgi:probable rRNA maturation factor